LKRGHGGRAALQPEAPSRADHVAVNLTPIARLPLSTHIAEGAHQRLGAQRKAAVQQHRYFTLKRSSRYRLATARGLRGMAQPAGSPAFGLMLAIGAVFVLIAVGTGGYMLLDRMSFIDALYMTVITITTVGYEEVRPLDTRGRIFTMALILSGVGIAFYVFGRVTEVVVGGQFRAIFERGTMNRRIHQLEKHVVLCGYGRFGQIVAAELRRDGIELVVIENDPAKEGDLIRNGELYVMGSALDESVLEQAGIDKAAEIVIATASDPDNVYISLSARSRTPSIRVHARAESEMGLKHLRLAGVARAISSYQWSALRIANAIARPSVVDFLSLILPGHGDPEIVIEEIVINEGSHLIGRSIDKIEREFERVRIVGMKPRGGEIELIPAAQTELRAGDLIISIGPRTSFDTLAARVR
jgi:voltage-gated potassium channel